MPFGSGWERVITGNAGKIPLGKSAVANRYVLHCEILVGGEVLKAEFVRMPIKYCDMISGMDWLTSWYPRCYMRNRGMGAEEVFGATLRFIA
jgi:hypothetical protein